MYHGFAFLQTATSDFKNDSIDTRLLDKLFINALNILRLENNLYPFEREDGVQLAASDHANYMKRHGKLEHEEKEKTKSNVEKRLIFFSSKCIKPAEILLYFPVRKKKKKELVNKRYSEVAYGILAELQRKPDDLAKLTNAEADSYGFAVEPDGDSALYVVIIIARNPTITLKEKIPPSEFGVQRFDKKTCNCITQNQNFIAQNDLTLMVEGDSLFLKSEHLALLKKTFTGPKDAYYVDIVYRYQFPCGKENMLDESEIYDGTMMKPVKWPDLFARNRAKDGKNFYAFYALTPKNLKGYVLGYNTALVINGRMCSYHYTFSPPGENLQLVPLRPKWIYDEKLKLKADTFTGKIKIPFPFAVNETTLKQEYVKKLEKKLRNYSKYITKATIRTYSSIEGDEKSNLELQKKRADVIQSFLKKVAKKEVPVEVESKENWDFFLREMKAGSSQWLDTMSREEIRDMVNDKRWHDAFKPTLNKSREATLELELNADVTDQSDPDLIFAGFQRAVMLGDSGRSNTYQNKLLQHFFDNKISDAEILSFNLPFNKKFLKVWTNYLALKVNSKNNVVTENFTRDSVLKTARVDTGFAPLQFNFCLLALKHLASYDTLIPIPQLERKMRSSYAFARNKKDSVLINHMFLNYNLITLYLYWSSYQFDKINAPLNNIKKYYPIAEITEEEAIDIGLLFNFYTRWAWTQELLLPYMRSGTQNENTIFLFVQTAGSNPACGKEEWVKYLRKAKEINPERFTYWIDYLDFQLLRDDTIKEVFCE